MRAGVSSLFSDLDVEVTPDAPLGAETWYGIGGRADLLIRPLDVDALATLLHRCHRSGTPLRVLGSGANLLVGDTGIDGVVVKLDRPAFAETKFNPQGEIHAVRLMAGVDMARVVMDLTRHAERLSRGVGR